MSKKYNLFILLLLITCAKENPQDKNYTTDHQWKNAYPNSRKYCNYQKDTYLEKLIENALKYNFDYKIAHERIKASASLFEGAKANMLPNITLKSQINRSTLDTRIQGIGLPVNIAEHTTYDAQIQTAWEIDLFSKNYLEYLSKISHHKAQIAYKESIKLKLIADITLLYLKLIDWDIKNFLMTEIIALQKKQINFKSQKLKKGLVNQDSIIIEKNKLYKQEKELANIQIQKEKVINKICFLTGKNPCHINLKKFRKTIFDKKAISIVPPQIHLDTPIETLKKRPDIIEAEAHYNSAFYKYRETKRLRFPKINLLAAFGIQGAIHTPSLQLWSVGAQNVMNLIDFGKTENEIEHYNAKQKEAYFLLKRTMLKALCEIENFLKQNHELNNKMQAAIKNLHSLEIQSNLAKKRYKAGIESEYSFNQKQIKYLQQLATTYHDTIMYNQSHIYLMKSLGVIDI